MYAKAVEALREQAEVEENKPLTWDELKRHLSGRHPYEVEPLYVVFDPPLSLDFPRWRDAYNLSQLVEHGEAYYGKVWLAYRHKPKEEHNMSNWISVKDRLPDKYGTYLIMRKGRVMFANRDELLRHPIWNVEEYGISIIPDSEVTHWMPLPEPPKEGTT